jgi:quinoprotein relay system zinc metallohydrolase 2
MTRGEFLTGIAAFSALPWLPVIRAAAAEPGAFATAEIAPGVHVHQGRYELSSPENRGDIANCAFIVGDESVAVIDTGGSALVGRDLRAAVRKVTDKPVRYVVNTHMHPDHVLGNVAFEDDKPQFVGHAKLARGLAARTDRYMLMNKEAVGEAAFADSKIIPPTLAVQDRLELDLGNRTLVLEAQKTAHTDNDLVVTDKTTDTLILGDLLFSVHIPTLDGSIRGWLAVLDKLSAIPAARVVPGHGPASMDWPAAAEPVKRYLNLVASDVRRMIQEGKTLAEASKTAAQSERDKWQLFDEFNARNVSAAFAELEWE